MHSLFSDTFSLQKTVINSYNVSKPKSLNRDSTALLSVSVSVHSWIFSRSKNNLLHFIYIVIIDTTTYLFIFICSTKSKIVVQIAQKSRSVHFSNASKAETILTQLFSLFEALRSAIHIEFYSEILSGNLLTWQKILYFYYSTRAIITHGWYSFNPLFHRP